MSINLLPDDIYPRILFEARAQLAHPLFTIRYDTIEEIGEGDGSEGGDCDEVICAG